MSPDELLEMVHEAFEFENAIIDHGIILVSYVDPSDGSRNTGWVVVGEPSIDQTIGLIAIAQHRIDHHTTEGS